MKGFPTIPKACPNFTKFLGFGYGDFSLTKFTNIQYNSYKPTLVHLYSSKAFQEYQEHRGGTMVWELSMDPKKTNKQHSLIYVDLMKPSNVHMCLSNNLQSSSGRGYISRCHLGAVSGFNFIAYLGKNKEQSKTPIQM